MDQRTPPGAGVVVSLAVVVAVLAPYLLLSPQAASAVPAYYGYGLVGPWGPGLLALVATVAFAAGRRGRTPPETVAGATLALGIAAVVLAAEWALAVDPALVQSIGTADWLGTHRWVLVGLAALLPVVAGWYAATLELV